MSTAAIAPAIGPAIARPATNVSHTSSAPAIGVKMKMASKPPIAINGASSSEKPGAHTGADAEGFVSEVTNPPGVNVFACLRPRHLCDEIARRLQLPRRERVGHQRVARRIRSAGGVRARTDNPTAATPIAAASAIEQEIRSSGDEKIFLRKNSPNLLLSC